MKAARGFSPVVAALLLTACSSMGSHQGVPDTPVTVSEIQRAIACEFAYAFQRTSGRGRDELEQWGAIVELKLGVKDSVNVIPGVGAFTGKVGNATLKTEPSALTLDSVKEQKNTMAYFVPIKAHGDSAVCPAQNSRTASSGLELADLLIGTAQVINSNGVITSTASLSTAGIEVNGTLIGPGSQFPGFAVVPARIPTIRYQRTFKVTRKIGGGLTFEVGDVSLSLKGTGAERTRALEDNKIVITMGAMQAPERDETAGSELEDSIWEQRRRELELYTLLTPNEVIVVNPPSP